MQEMDQTVNSVHENHPTRWTIPMAKPKYLKRDFTNFNRTYKAHRKLSNKDFSVGVQQIPMASHDGDYYH